MTLRARRVLFYSLIFVFIAVGASVILYAQGFRIDSGTFSLTTRGGMYIVPSPTNAVIEIDGHVVSSNSGLFQRGTLVNGLVPKNHTLELSAPGYRPWKRTLAILPSKVAEVQYAVLIPDSSVATTMGTDVRGLWLTQNSALMLQTGTSSFSIGETAFTAPGSPGAPNAATWNNARTQFLVQGPSPLNGSLGAYFLVDVGTTIPTSTVLTGLITKTGANPALSSTHVALDTAYENRLIVQSPAGIWLVDTKNPTASKIASLSKADAETPIAISSSRALVAWSVYNSASSTSLINLYDRGTKQVRAMNAVFTGTVKSIHFENGSLVSIIQTNGDLFTYDLGNSTLTKRGAKVRQALFSADDRMLALLGEDSVEIVSVGTTDYVRFNLKSIKDAATIAWHKNDHGLFITYSDHVTFLDVEDSLQETVGDIAAEKSVYDAETNKLYVLNGGTVSAFQFANN